MDAGYSGVPLLKKLGYQTGQSILLLNSPDWFQNELRRAGIEASRNEPATWAHFFCESQEQLADFLDSVDLDQIEKGFWVSWPKKSSGIKTDVTEQTFRDVILPLGWVDTKVAAIDETWSGLKFLRRKSPAPTQGDQ
jgi:hypothetical protein